MRRPNILIMYTDQQRWDCISAAAGNDEIVTPNLDELAKGGVSFNRCYVQNPVCMPSRLSFLTGQYPSTLKIPHMAVPVPEDIPTIQRILGDTGYYTANIGKLHFLPHANRDHRKPHPSYGFDHLQLSDEPGMYEDAYHAWVQQKYPEHMDKLSFGLPPLADTWCKAGMRKDTVKHQTYGPRNDFKGAYPHQAPWDATHSAFVGDQTCEFLKSRKGNGQPFFCIAGFYSPHAPFYVPQRFLDLYDPEKLSIQTFPEHIEEQRKEGHFSDAEIRAAKHGYYALISEVDHWVGEIMSTLKGAGLYEDTIVVFTSDHGERLGDHLKWAKGFPGDDSCTHVPLLIHWPNQLADGLATVEDIIEAVDVMPTLLEAAFVQPPPYVRGRSLMPYLKGTEIEPKTSALTEEAGWRNIRTDRYRYQFRADGGESLWDFETDPTEDTDVAADPEYKDVLAELRHEMLKRQLEIECPLERTWGY